MIPHLSLSTASDLNPRGYFSALHVGSYSSGIVQCVPLAATWPGASSLGNRSGPTASGSGLTRLVAVRRTSRDASITARGRSFGFGLAVA